MARTSPWPDTHPRIGAHCSPPTARLLTTEDVAPEGGEIASARGNRVVERPRQTAPNSGCHARNPPLVITTRPAEFLMNRTIRL